jgi:hypothetical protein
MIRRLPTAAVVPVIMSALMPVAHAASASLESLLRNSPFSGPTSAAPGARPDLPLEFRGMMVDRGEQFFSLYDTVSHASLWVGLNEPGNPFKVQNYDSAKATVTVDFQGRILTLPIKQAKIAAMAPGAPTPAAAPGVQTPGGPPLPNLNAANATEEAARLSAVAEEIRRRRALRQQQVSANSPMTPAPTPPATRN